MVTQADAIRAAYAKGYRADEHGVVTSPKGRILRTSVRGTSVPYLHFGVVVPGSRTPTGVPVHRLVAFQKFGEAALEEGIQTRHLDNDPLNNSALNIALGTRADNYADMPAAERQRCQRAGSAALQRLTRQQADLLRARKQQGETAAELAVEFGVSVRTIYYTINRVDYTQQHGLE